MKEIIIGYSIIYWYFVKKTQNHFIKWNQHDYDFNHDSFKFKFSSYNSSFIISFCFFDLIQSNSFNIRDTFNKSRLKFKLLSISKSIIRTISSRVGKLLLLLFIGKLEIHWNYELRWCWKKQMIFKITRSHYWYIENEIRFCSKMKVLVSAGKRMD